MEARKKTTHSQLPILFQYIEPYISQNHSSVTKLINRVYGLQTNILASYLHTSLCQSRDAYRHAQEYTLLIYCTESFRRSNVYICYL